jgi:hypothetical protein
MLVHTSASPHEIDVAAESGTEVVATESTSTVRITLTEAASDGSVTPVSGMIRCRATDVPAGMQSESIEIPELLNRGTGIALAGDDAVREIHSWYVLPRETTITLPSQQVTIEAFSGIETETARVDLDLRGTEHKELSIPLKRFSDVGAGGARSANTHLHIMKLTRSECDRYLTEIPAADRLDVVFVSHLERAVVDATYITNRYTTADLKRLSDKTGVQFGWGEEHRHNMPGNTEGFGHVMLLNIQKLIQPVSIGQGIMKQGTDGIPLARGVSLARRDGATVVWCHNGWGRESVPNLVLKNVDAVNIFDGSSRSSYSDSFYRYLNAGLRIPFSTGTDWCQYDFSRVYVQVSEPLSTESWLRSLREGRSVISNGPLLDFQVSGKQVGDTVSLNTSERTLKVRGTAKGRRNFDRVELIVNGGIVATQAATAVESHFEADLETTVTVDKPGWLALRTPPPSVSGDQSREQQTPLNEYGREMFAHTSPIYIEVSGKKHFNRGDAASLLAEMQRNRDLVSDECQFADAHERSHVLEIYEDGIQHIQKQLSEAASDSE